MLTPFLLVTLVCSLLVTPVWSFFVTQPPRVLSRIVSHVLTFPSWSDRSLMGSHVWSLMGTQVLMGTKVRSLMGQKVLKAVEAQARTGKKMAQGYLEQEAP